LSHIKKYEHKRSSLRFDVTEFGAAADGEADDSKAINQAINATQDAGGGTVFFPKGTYRCMALRPKSYVSLQGTGWGESILRGFNDHSDKALIDATGDYSEKSPLTEFNMSDLELDGHEMNRTGYHYNRKGIGNQWQRNCVFRNVFVHDTPATGIGTDFTINVYFTNCIVKDCGTPGVVGNGVGSNGFGIGVSDNTEVVVFSGCQALGIANNGFTLEAQTTQGVGYASISDCYTERCQNAGYSNSGSQGVNISGCTDSASKYGVYVSTNAKQPATQTIVSGCEFQHQQSHGIYSDYAENTHLNIRGCLFNQCGGSGVRTVGSYCSISDNTFKSCKEATILVQPAAGAVAKSYLVTDNVILNGESDGIQIDPANKEITGLLVKDNMILDCKGSAVKALCKAGVASGNFVAAVIEGNVCSGNQKPQVAVLGMSSNLVVRNNIE
jgi:Endopolygalacturonase